MILVEDSLHLLATPAEIWAVLSDVPRWWPHIYHGFSRIPQDPAWSNTIKRLGGEGAGMRFAAHSGAWVKQSMRITEWTPPARLALATDPWDCEKEHERMRKLGDGRLAQLIRSFHQCQFSIRFDLSALSARETVLSLRFEFAFLNPFSNLVFGLPAKSMMRTGVRQFMQRFPHWLES